MPKQKSIENIRMELDNLLAKLSDDEQEKWLREKLQDRMYRAV